VAQAVPQLTARPRASVLDVAWAWEREPSPAATGPVWWPKTVNRAAARTSSTARRHSARQRYPAPPWRSRRRSRRLPDARRAATSIAGDAAQDQTDSTRAPHRRNNTMEIISNPKGEESALRACGSDERGAGSQPLRHVPGRSHERLIVRRQGRRCRRTGRGRWILVQLEVHADAGNVARIVGRGVE
jgi:hypothetical protein